MYLSNLSEHAYAYAPISGMHGIVRSGFGQARSYLPLMPVDPQAGTERVVKEDSIPLISTVAKTPEEVERARELVRKRYTRLGYRMVEDSGIPFPNPERAASFFPIISVGSGSILGTATLGIDSPAGLTVDEANQETADAIRSEGGRICEIVRLAIEDGVNSRAILCSIFSCIYRTCTGRFEWTDLLVEVVPRHIPFYQRLFGFTQASGVRLCERVGGVKSVVLRLQRSELERRLSSGSPFPQ